MTGGVDNRYNSQIRSADVGGRRLLGVNGLTHWVNTGKTMPDTYNGKTNNHNKSGIGGFLTLVSSSIAAGVGIYYLNKTGKLDKIKDFFADLGGNISKKISEANSAIKKRWNDEVAGFKKYCTEANSAQERKIAEKKKQKAIKKAEAEAQKAAKKAEADAQKAAKKAAADAKKAEKKAAAQAKKQAKIEAKEAKKKNKPVKTDSVDKPKKEGFFAKIFKKKDETVVETPSVPIVTEQAERKAQDVAVDISDSEQTKSLQQQLVGDLEQIKLKKEAELAEQEAKRLLEKEARAAEDKFIEQMRNPSGLTSDQWKEFLAKKYRGHEVLDKKEAAYKELLVALSNLQQQKAAQEAAAKASRTKVLDVVEEVQETAQEAVSEIDKIARAQAIEAEDKYIAKVQNPSGKTSEEWLEELTSAFKEDEAKKAEISNLANVLKAKLAKDESEALAAQHAAQVAQHKVQQEVQEAVFELPQEVEKTAPEVHQLLGLKLGSKSAEESANAFIELEKEAQVLADKWSLDRSFFVTSSLRDKVEDLIASSPKKMIVPSMTHPNDVIDILIDNKTGTILSEMIANPNCLDSNCAAYGGVTPEFIFKLLKIDPSQIKENKLYRIKFSSNPDFVIGTGANRADFVQEPLLKFSKKPNGFIEYKSHISDETFLAIMADKSTNATYISKTPVKTPVETSGKSSSKKQGIFAKLFGKK